MVPRVRVDNEESDKVVLANYRKILLYVEVMRTRISTGNTPIIVVLRRLPVAIVCMNVRDECALQLSPTRYEGSERFIISQVKTSLRSMKKP